MTDNSFVNPYAKGVKLILKLDDGTSVERKLKIRWNIEIATELERFHNVDGKEEFIKMLADAFQMEVYYISNNLFRELFEKQAENEQ